MIHDGATSSRTSWKWWSTDDPSSFGVLPVFLGFPMVFLWFTIPFLSFRDPKPHVSLVSKTCSNCRFNLCRRYRSFFEVCTCLHYEIWRYVYLPVIKRGNWTSLYIGNFNSLGKSSIIIYNWVIFHYHVWSPGYCFCWAWALGQNITPLCKVVVCIVNISPRPQGKSVMALSLWFAHQLLIPGSISLNPHPHGLSMEEPPVKDGLDGLGPLTFDSFFSGNRLVNTIWSYEHYVNICPTR